MAAKAGRPGEGLESRVEGFNERAREAVKDEQLRSAVAVHSKNTIRNRNAALSALPDAPELRERAYHIKQETMANLDRHLERMASAVEKRGGKVFFANDGEEAVRYIGELARRRGAKVITKSKSMATEEIELNRRLQEEYPELGLEIVETDLGEWIAQLAGEAPSHIVAPILHMSRHRAAGVLSEEAGHPLPPNVEDLVSFARERLRQKFLSADIGITGANFGVSETGTVVTATNEGNEGLVASVPSVHVAVMGIEKVVPRLEDLAVFLRLLARSATGQKMTVYTDFVSGPKGEDEPDGPEEFHLVLLDNGRSSLLGGEFEEALYCIRCGACLNVCPVYRQTGGHAYGSTYSGPIGAVITPLLKGDEEAKDLPHASSLCGACWEACPVGIPLHELLLRLRRRQAETGISGRAQRLAFDAFEFGMRRPGLYGIGAKAARGVQGPLLRDGVARSLPGPLKGWAESREIPHLAEKSFRELWREGRI